ncbi:MAG: type I-D CRISPR-associated protein Cas5/Csc1 [Anaerolineae bacterium]|nr:type I-D CRISPR-associated protein Cas5/Csc1 [Anaerolineae bacterium]MCX8066814.1 type I-D CRISPR-associated protein Cas5/Csc1 [Anaerolineae bacterium]MDW7991310.1 type I-D CRISPR-associated protein Cas5/Csc1 [Anaerolineae bacterium]
MHIHRVTVELLDYVFFATTERGKVHETGAFLHNYALTYALGLGQGETYTYTSLVQRPHYEEELTPLNGILYLTPAAPLKAQYRVIQWNSTGESFVLSRGQSVGYPDWGFARMLRPGSRFRFYLLIFDPERLPPAPALRGLLAGRPVRIRLGKFPAKARLWAEPAREVRERTGDFLCEAMLNWWDLEADPVVCDIVVAGRPTLLLTRARFEREPCYEAHFEPEGTVVLPARMRFLARMSEQSRKRAR